MFRPHRFVLPGHEQQRQLIRAIFLLALVILGGTLASAFMATRRPWEAALGLATLAAGVPVYLLMRALASRSGSPRAPRD